MTTKLIQELVGLCVEKRLTFHLEPESNCIFIESTSCIVESEYIDITIETDQDYAPEQLQAAIDKAKAL